MPRTRWTLTATEQVEHVSRAEQLRAMGIGIEVPRLASSTPIADFEIGYAPEFHNVILNIPGRIVVATGARILARRPILLEGHIDVKLPWNGPEFELLYPDENRPYRLASELTFDREDVLNHRLQEGIKLRRGDVLEGMLLLVAYQAQLPEQYCHGTPIRVRIALWDSLGAEIAAQGTVRVNRRMEVAPRVGPRWDLVRNTCLGLPTRFLPTKLSSESCSGSRSGKRRRHSRAVTPRCFLHRRGHLEEEGFEIHQCMVVKTRE